ncbi:MAG TPA: phosphate ABC transporter permease subunit PstC [Solirubrobacteraceae bacterium]|nr:phosphate ABC transporter permease subunit PstC [Solirubrobacteraceae bacterium]
MHAAPAGESSGARPRSPAPARSGTQSDRRTERVLGALAAGVLGLIALMTITVFAKAWPSFSHNGLTGWFQSGGDVDQQLREMLTSGTQGGHPTYHLRAWPLLWGTILTTGLAVLIGIVFSTFAAIFIVEFAPAPVRRVIEPIVRLLGGVPSVVYGLIGILAIAPWVNHHLLSESRKSSVEYLVQLAGSNLSTATLILTVMITPIMVAIVSSSLAAVPGPWTEGSAALGVNRWRTIWRISLRTARPAIIAAAVLATARALGEAIMLSMVSGGRGFAANPIDGITFLFEPVRPLAATIVQNSEALSAPSLGRTLYAMAAVLMVSAALLSLAGWAAKQPLKRYGIRA